MEVRSVTPLQKLTALRRGILPLALTISFLSTSCAAPGIVPQTEISPSQVQQSWAQSDTTEDTHLRVEVELSNSLFDDKQVLEIWYVRPDSIRLEILESTLPGLRDIITASQGHVGWTYRRATRQVHTGPVDEVKPAIVYDVVQSALSLLYDKHPERVAAVSTDYVNRKWAYRLTGLTDPDSCTVWLEQETLQPLKLRCESQRLGQYSLTVHEAEYNLGLTDDLFDLTLLPAESYTVQRID